MAQFNQKSVSGLGDDFLQIGDKDYIRLSSIVSIYETFEYGHTWVQISLAGLPHHRYFKGTMEEFQVALLEHQTMVAEREELAAEIRFQESLKSAQTYF